MFPYFGRKDRIKKYYPAPKNKKIIEPFAGSAPYSLLYWEHDITIVDKYNIIIEVWKYLQSASKNDILKLPKIKKGDDIRDFNLSKIERKFMGFCIMHGIVKPANIVTMFGAQRNGIWWENKKVQIANDLYKIKHWNIICDDYFTIQNEKATWFIDPPYQKEGGSYIYNKINYEYLAKWCKNRKGQIIVCENVEADWLPFKPLNKKFQITQRKKQFKEGIWTN